MTKYVYITGLALILAACSNSSDTASDVTTEASAETSVKTEATRVVDNEPTGMNAGATEPVDMDYTRITFEKGAVSAQVDGKLTGFEDENEFVIDVAAGQTMTVKKATDDMEMITIQVMSPLGEQVADMQANCNGNHTIDLKTSGDYSIIVTQCMKADEWNNDYKLDVTVK